MDGNIRQLIVYSRTVDEAAGVKLVVQAYKYLQQAFLKSKNDDSADTCGSDLYVQCAEIALKLKQTKVSQECLQMYFSGTPLTNQFLCRAYLCQAQLLSPKSADDAVGFETAVVYLLKAVNFAKDKSRYHFIVYNASVLYWQMARPFLREGYKGLLHASLNQVVGALDTIDDSDHEWRVQLMIALIESYIDAGCMKEATATSQTAAQFAINSTPGKYKDVIALQIKHKLVDFSKLSKDVASMPQFSAFLRLQRIKSALAGKSKLDIPTELQKLVAVVSGRGEPPVKPGSRDGRGHRNSIDDTISTDDSSRSSSVASAKTASAKAATTGKPLAISVPLHSQREVELLIRPQLLIDLARLCTDSNNIAQARTCLAALKECENLESTLLMECELIECDIMVRQLGEMQESYTKSAVKIRLAAIKRLDQALQNALRSGNSSLVQGACASQWNLCLPLLQRNLRQHIRSQLSRVAEALGDISSLQVKLRCQVHMELAKCEESVEQIEAAVKHLNKALQLDDSGQYHERLHTMLHRLQLSTQLYRQPDRPEDVAAIIIEQARKSAGSGTTHMKRSLLIKAGLALAPDAFQYVLDSENEMKVLDAFNIPSQKEKGEGAKSGMKGIASPVQLLAARALQWKKCVRKAPGHLKRLGSENDRERARLWVDLAKAARQQQVWDVCRVACTFCLLYDDGRWKMPAKEDKDRTGSKRGTRSAGSTAKSPTEEEKTPESTLQDADLLRALAEVRFICGEAYIDLLRDDGLKLNESPSPPVDMAKGQEKPVDHVEWTEYADWIDLINREATNAFLRAIELGIELDESWIVCSGAVYLWNYNNHLIANGEHSRLVPTFEKVLFGMQQIGHGSEATLLVRICDVIAKGLLTPWIPKKVPDDPMQPPAATTTDDKRKKTGGKGTGTNAAPASNVLTMDPSGIDDVKRALTVCEYGLQVTNGSQSTNIIPTHVRHQLLATFVRIKQMLQMQLAPNFASEIEKLPSQQSMSKTLVILEALSLNHNGLMEINAPELSEVCDMAKVCAWNDSGVELEVWSRLAKLANLQRNHSLVLRCGGKALELESSAVPKKDAKASRSYQHRRKVALEMLAYTACILGESLMETCSSNPSARRQAMHRFVSSARYAGDADNLALVMTACKRWWNAALPLIPTPLERELLRQPLELLLKFVLHTSRSSSSYNFAKEPSLAKDGDESKDTLGDVFDDQALRAAMYGLLFQTYADKGEWEDGLAVMDKAIHNMPRTQYRLLLFKHRVIVKAKLGKNVQMDIAKFKDESEDYVSHMWHRVALCSRNTLEQLSAFQQAIEALHSDETRWQKFEYLLELSTWMFSNEFPVQDTVNVIEWACDILLSMKFEVEVKEEKQERVKGRKSKASKSMSRGAPTSQSNHANAFPKQAKIVEEESSQLEVNNDADPSKENLDIPNERTPLIGINATNLNLKVEDLGSVRQLEGLIRGHVMMATISGRGNGDHLACLQLAYSFVMRLWKIALASAGVVMKRLPKPDTTAEGDRKTSGNKKRAKSSQKATPAVVAERPKRKGPLDALPTSTMEWSTYEAPEEIRHAFLNDFSDCGINKQTIAFPGMTVYYLLKLSDYLRDSSYNHLAFPVLCLAAVITQAILQSSSWTQSVNIRQMIICYELHLENSARYWETLMDNKFLTEAEQNKSRLELGMKRIHKELAKQEEERIRKVNAEDEAYQNRKSSSKTSKNEDAGPDTLAGRKIGGVRMSEIWSEKARLLLRLGYHQDCRLLLNEALTVANYNDDSQLKAEIYHGLASLAIAERNSGQSLQLIRRAQMVGGDEPFWQENITLLVDAIMTNPDPSPDDLTKVSKITRISLECLSKLQEKRPTKKTTIGYIKATLSAHVCLLKLSTGNYRAADQLKKLQQAEEFLQENGFFRKLASIHLEHSTILLKLSETEPNMQKSYLLSAIGVLQASMANLTSICNVVVPLESDREVSLPVQRELIDVQLNFVAILLRTAAVSADDDRAAKAREEAKGELQRKVEKFIGEEEEEANELQKMWEAEKPTFLHRAFTILNTLHNDIPKQHVLRAKWLHLIGKSLRLLAETSHPIPPINQWEVSNYVSSHVLRGDSADVSIKELDGEVPVDNDEAEEPVEESKPLTQEGLQVKRNSELANRLLCQATEVLGQSINLALQLQAWQVISDAALDMVECTAQCDASMAATYLALHQSAETSMNMKNLLTKSLSEPNTSQLATLLCQDDWLMRDHVTTGLHVSASRKEVHRILDEKYVAWKRMKLVPSYNTLLKDLPPSFNIVVLQHCRKRKQLYCAVLDKAKPQVSQGEGKGKAKDKPVVLQSPTRAFIECIPVDTKLYAETSEVSSDFQLRLMSFLLQTEYLIFQLGMRKKMLQQLSKSPAEAVISETTLEEQATEEKKLKEDFEKILFGTEAYLATVTSQIHEKLVRPMSEQEDPLAENGPNPEHVIILADASLMHLPLETLQCFRSRHVTSVSRDFSLQMLSRRWTDEVTEAVATDKKKQDGKRSKTPKGGRDSERKPATAPKGGTTTRDVTAASRAVNTNSVHFMVDPHNESSETEEFRPDQTFKQMLQTYPQFTSRWAGRYGADALSSVGQWEEALRGCSAFLYYGMERFIAQHPPFKLTSLNMEECEFVLLLDKAQTHHSFRHQSKIDVEKTSNLLSIEKPLETAMFLSLCGVNSICLNQWHSTSQENAFKLRSLLDSNFQEGRDMGGAVRKMTFPTLMARPPSVERPPSVNKSKDKGKRSTPAKDKNAGRGPSRQISNQPANVEEEALRVKSVSPDIDEKALLEAVELNPSVCNLMLFGLPNVKLM